MALKRKEDHDGGHPPAKRARLLRVEDAEESAGSLVRVFWQHSSEAQTRVALKRKEEDYDGDHPAAKRARLSQVEDPQETFRSLGRTTLQERPEDADDDDILILYDEDLVKEIDNLLSDLML